MAFEDSGHPGTVENEAHHLDPGRLLTANLWRPVRLNFRLRNIPVNSSDRSVFPLLSQYFFAEVYQKRGSQQPSIGVAFAP